MKMQEYVAVKITPNDSATAYTLEVVPNADVVPVVRCKNCMYIAENFDPDRLYCKLWKHFVTEKWFCADGEMIEK